MNKTSIGDANTTVEIALQSYPLQPAPPMLRPRVMSRIQQMAPLPHFRLTWLDYALGVLGSGMAVTPLVVWQFLTPQMLIHFQVELFILTQRFSPSFLLPIFLPG